MKAPRIIVLVEELLNISFIVKILIIFTKFLLRQAIFSQIILCYAPVHPMSIWPLTDRSQPGRHQSTHKFFFTTSLILNYTTWHSLYRKTGPVYVYQNILKLHELIYIVCILNISLVKIVYIYLFSLQSTHVRLAG